MGDVRLDFEEGYSSVNIEGKCIGRIEYLTDPYHNSHYYLKLQLQYYDIGVAKKIFDLLSEKLDKPMQVMISSEEECVVSFIQAAGFVCRRKCYEIEAFDQDYIGRMTKERLPLAMIGNDAYEDCCEMMLNRYISTHKAINPWTGTKEDFFKRLPKTVFYEMDNDKIKSFAFVEENEIAYVCGVDRVAFLLFAKNLLTELFRQNETVVFEADDCDEYAMELKTLFTNQPEKSFDTYVLK